MMEMGSLELARLSPARSIRQRVKYSMGNAPIVCLNFRSKVDRDMPARSASFCIVWISASAGPNSPEARLLDWGTGCGLEAPE
jgi:hypothetical protein